MVHCITEKGVIENLKTILFGLRTCLSPSHITFGVRVTFVVVVDVFNVVNVAVFVAVFSVVVLILAVVGIVVVSVIVVFVVNLTVNVVCIFSLVRLRHDDDVWNERAVFYIA